MSNPLDTESRSPGIVGVLPRNPIPVQPFPRFPTIIKTKNPDIQQAWGAVEIEIDRWRMNLMSAIQGLQQPDFGNAIKAINGTISAMQNTIASITNLQAASASSIKNLANQINVDLSPYLNRETGGTMIGDLILAHDPVKPLEAATRQFVLAQIGSEQRVFEFPSPTNPWPVPHNAGKYPTSVRILVQLPSLAYLVQFSAGVVDVDINHSQITFGGNYQGKAVVGFA